MRDDPHGTLFIYETPTEVAKALADLFIEHANTSIGSRGRFVVALAGGTTPRATYDLFPQTPYCDAIDWDSIEFFFGDERCVPPDNDQSNYKMAYETFLKPMRIADKRIHRMHG
ncbi:MAG TPA: 6-phosphogluconolactonase, partial [Candidatus Aquilonibacter sp.]